MEHYGITLKYIALISFFNNKTFLLFISFPATVRVMGRERVGGRTALEVMWVHVTPPSRLQDKIWKMREKGTIGKKAKFFNSRHGEQFVVFVAHIN